MNILVATAIFLNSIFYPAKYGQMDGTLYVDIMSHCSPGNRYLSASRDTNAHETSHGINNDLRNSTQAWDGGFYLGNNRAYLILQPNIEPGLVKRYIPQCVRFDRYNLYVNKMNEINNEPLYLMDEWCAYIIGGAVAYQDALAGYTYAKNFDSLMGSMELGVFSIALCMAIEKHDPEYWSRADDLKEFVKLELYQTVFLYKMGKDYYPWKEQDMLWDRLNNHPECQQIRDFINRYFPGILLN